MDAGRADRAREQAREALERGNLATDPDLQREWFELAEAWAKVAVEAGQRGSKSSAKPRIVIRNPD